MCSDTFKNNIYIFLFLHLINRMPMKVKSAWKNTKKRRRRKNSWSFEVALVYGKGHQTRHPTIRPYIFIYMMHLYYSVLFALYTLTSSNRYKNRLIIRNTFFFKSVYSCDNFAPTKFEHIGVLISNLLNLLL